MNNTHGILEQTMKWIALYLPSVYAGLCALGISALIDIRAGKPKLYTATGALICGIFALAVSALLEYLGLPANSGAFVGALVGFVGADRLRDMALAIVARRAGVSSTEEKQ
ncbi:MULTISPECIES: phage holin, lambda family [Enterobacteriaceae]|jgi:lambda family phage holin|uniref:Phage holin, lambda family n=1 Tax=Citrobacter koseri TaxID=545 RepID=A0AAQ0V6C7_CITKO|nr:MULTISPECIES: phage holin, lambda family [Enterobacteriaceae]KWZ97598.1 phage holin, lambda family [Citrobacter koseri]KXA01685.1 phage holin, lambda family [Citrobacter koseri]MBJ8714446.1 phage holin, lambda family [Citrobacter koseri]MBJ8752024.1 phage holin, lambda family [Citrobacter koseri]MBJ8754118.1 phage holin, lambda family [Citrobacter koseri]